MAETLIEFMDSLGKAGQFRAGCIYQPEADLISVQFEDSPYYAERVDKFLTVYQSFDGGQLVGFELKGIRHKIEEMISTLSPADEPATVKLDVKCEPHINLLLTFYMKEPLQHHRDTYERIYQLAKQLSSLRIPKELVH